jgi:hypothetical protein
VEHKLLGDTLAFWCQTIFLSVSALSAVWIIGSSKSSERRRATLDVLTEQKRDQALTEAKKAMLVFHSAPGTNFAAFISNPQSDEYAFIMRILNSHEFVAAAIHHGALDECLYRDMQNAVVMRDWNAMQSAVMELRKVWKVRTLFCEFEKLAVRWDKRPFPRKSWRFRVYRG